MTSNPILDSLPTQLNEEATRFLLNYGKRIEYKAGETIVREGEDCDEIFIVLDGSARVIKNDAAGHSNIIATVGKGAIIGEMGIFLDLKRSATITADSPLTAIRLTNETFIRAIQDFPAIPLRLLRSLSSKLHEINQKLVLARHSHHMLYLGLRMQELHRLHPGTDHTHSLNLAAVAEHAGLQPLDLTNALLDYQRLGIIHDLQLQHGRLASFTLKSELLREFIERAAQA